MYMKVFDREVLMCLLWAVRFVWLFVLVGASFKDIRVILGVEGGTFKKFINYIMCCRI